MQREAMELSKDYINGAEYRLRKELERLRRQIGNPNLKYALICFFNHQIQCNLL